MTHSLGSGTTYGAFTLSGGPFEVTSAPPPGEYAPEITIRDT